MLRPELQQLAYPLWLILNFSPRRFIVMTNMRAKNYGERSTGSKDRLKTNGRTDTTTRLVTRIIIMIILI